MQKSRIELAGYLAAKPILRFLASGTKVANARLGESYKHQGQDGQIQTHTNWHSLTFYDQLAELAVTYEQGENVFVEGAIQQRKFTPKDGVTRTVHEVIVRSCHVVEPPRIDVMRAGSSGGLAAPSITPAEEPQGYKDDATWPV